jgi:hypothetical protein
MTTVCIQNAGKVESKCFFCDKNYYGFGKNLYEKCNIGNEINHCEFYKNESSGLTCDACRANYAVDFGRKKCVSYTYDPNCRSLHQGATRAEAKDACHFCWHSYYWSYNICRMGSEVLVKGGLWLGLVVINFVF